MACTGGLAVRLPVRAQPATKERTKMAARPTTPADVAPLPAVQLEQAKLRGIEPDPFLYAHASAPGYTSGTWGEHYAVITCLGCGGTGAIDHDSWEPVPVMPGYQWGTCPVCLGTKWQPTLGTLKLALKNARQQATSWADTAAAYAYDAGQLVLAQESPDVAYVQVLNSDGTHVVHELGDIPDLAARIEERGQRALRNQWLCEYDAQALDEMLGIVSRLRTHVKGQRRKLAAVQASASTAPAAAPKHDPRTVCNGYETKGGKRKRCHREPKEWDAQGKGWCRRHAHKRGLHKPEEEVA